MICWKWLSRDLAYDGSQLRGGWIAEQTGIGGDGIVAFTGAAEVGPEHMVDLEDIAAKAWIYSPLMLHLLAEHHGLDLLTAVGWQRLLIVLIEEELRGAKSGLSPLRRGDDLFIEGRKLSVSIATTSTTSALIHVGINVQSAGTPVPTIGLEELGITARPFAEVIMNRYVEEIASMRHAIGKVKMVE